MSEVSPKFLLIINIQKFAFGKQFNSIFSLVQVMIILFIILFYIYIFIFFYIYYQIINHMAILKSVYNKNI